MKKYIDREAVCSEIDKGDFLVDNNAEWAKKSSTEHQPQTWFRWSGVRIASTLCFPIAMGNAQKRISASLHRGTFTVTEKGRSRNENHD